MLEPREGVGSSPWESLGSFGDAVAKCVRYCAAAMEGILPALDVTSVTEFFLSILGFRCFGIRVAPGSNDDGVAMEETGEDIDELKEICRVCCVPFDSGEVHSEEVVG